MSRRWERIAGHGSVLGAQQHQGTRPVRRPAAQVIGNDRPIGVVARDVMRFLGWL
jgi:hypothetical protein